MSVNPHHLLARIRRTVTRRFLGLTSNKGGQCGTQNKANRDAWLERTLASIPGGRRILDAAAGELQYERFCAHLDYVSQDFAQYDGEGDGIGLQTGAWDQSQVDIVCDITSMPESDASFDAVMCIEVLEHLPDPISALREFKRLLKPGGTLIVTAPFCSLTHYSPHFYYTGYSSNFFQHWLTELGFEIEDIQWNGNYFEYLAQELRRLPWVREKYTDTTMTWSERIAINVVLGLVNRLSLHDNGSEQLLAYGLHIRARRR